MFLSKEDLNATAKAYGIDLSGMTFAQMQGKVSKHLAAEGLAPIHVEHPTPEKDELFDIFEATEAEDAVVLRQKKPIPMEKAVKVDTTPVKQKPVLVKGKARRRVLPTYTGARKGVPELAGKTILWSPEIRPNGQMIYRYEEDLGEDADVVELKYNGETLDERGIVPAPGSPYGAGASGTYKVKLRPGSHIKATSSLPKMNVKISQAFDADGMPAPRNSFPVVEYEGKQGYLYKHPSLPCVKQELIRSNYYYDFKDQLKDEPNIFYLGGILCIDIDFCEWMMKEIEDREVYKHGHHIR